MATEMIHTSYKQKQSYANHVQHSKNKHTKPYASDNYLIHILYIMIDKHTHSYANHSMRAKFDLSNRPEPKAGQPHKQRSSSMVTYKGL